MVRSCLPKRFLSPVPTALDMSAPPAAAVAAALAAAGAASHSAHGPYIAVRLVNPDEAKRFFKDFVDSTDGDNVGMMADTKVWQTDRGYVYLDTRWL